MEVKEEGEGEEGGEGTLRALGDLEFLTQKAEPSRTTLVDACNGFNELSRLTMMWTVRNFWPEGVRYTFNCYRRWVQLILRQPGELPVPILIREGVTQGDPLSMVLYGINLVPLVEKLRAADPGILSPFYADDAPFDGSARQSAQLLKMLMKKGTDQGYFPNPAKSLFISDTTGQEEAVRREFVAGGLELNFVSGSRYLGAYLVPQEELTASVKPQVEA